MSLTDLKKPLSGYRITFRHKSQMASDLRYMWFSLLDSVQGGDPPIDVIIWEVGNHVSVRPASTAIDESNPKFKRPLGVIGEVKGYKTEQKTISQQKGKSAAEIKKDLQSLHCELVELLKVGIEKAFNHSTTKTQYKKLNPKELPLTVVITDVDKGLQASEFELVCKNKLGLNDSQIRAKALKSKRKPLPTQAREPSQRAQRIAKIEKKNQEQAKAGEAYAIRAKLQIESKTPAIEKRLANQFAAADNQTTSKSKSQKTSKANESASLFFSLNDGNQNETLLVPEVSLKQLAEVQATYGWSDFDEYDNRLWAYMELLLDPIHKHSKNRKKYWQKLNRTQKLFFVLLDFNHETDNGGVWQFIFNSPQMIFAAMEALHEVGAKKVAKDLEAVLNECMKMNPSAGDLRKKFDTAISSKSAWESFAKGYDQLTSAKTIEKYFYSIKFKKEFYKQIVDTIENSLPRLVQVKAN